jgi:hypothetical protein
MINHLEGLWCKCHRQFGVVVVEEGGWRGLRADCVSGREAEVEVRAFGSPRPDVKRCGRVGTRSGSMSSYRAASRAMRDPHPRRAADLLPRAAFHNCSSRSGEVRLLRKSGCWAYKTSLRGLSCASNKMLDSYGITVHTGFMKG